jgi:hypothetical protein
LGADPFEFTSVDWWIDMKGSGAGGSVDFFGLIVIRVGGGGCEVGGVGDPLNFFAFRTGWDVPLLVGILAGCNPFEFAVVRRDVFLSLTRNLVNLHDFH